ncbi:MAG: enoyl-CoA hydratase/isomerase family protein [bacterium]|nr:enoyl-CoA hydratase/isomerase family protein [bacterium]
MQPRGGRDRHASLPAFRDGRRFPAPTIRTVRSAGRRWRNDVVTIQFETEGAVALLTIDRPKVHNALDFETSDALVAAWERFRDDDHLWIAVLTGAGERSFCAGADLRGVGDFYKSLTSTQRLRRSERVPGLGGITKNLSIDKPIIAAVNGHCLAGGLEIALACDLRVASENASFGLPEVTRGIIPGAGGTQRLPRLIGPERALDLIMSGRRIDAQEALRIGLVSRVVAQGDLRDEAMKTAQAIAANGPLAVRAAKAAVWRGLDMPLEEGLRLEQLIAEPVRQSEDAQEGPRAFLEKRKPEFKGK